MTTDILSQWEERARTDIAEDVADLDYFCSSWEIETNRNLLKLIALIRAKDLALKFYADADLLMMPKEINKILKIPLRVKKLGMNKRKFT